MRPRQRHRGAPHSARPIRGVVFDLDGVLVQSEHLGWIAWRDFLQPLGHEFSFDQYRVLIGTGETAHVIRQRYGLEIPLADLVLDHRRRLMALVQTDLVVTPGAIDTVTEVRARGRLVAVATNSPLEYVQRILELTNLGAYLDAVVTAGETGSAKPAPDVYLATATRLGVTPSQCLAVEDSPPGEIAALRAGMLCAIVPNRHLSSAGFSKLSPRFPTLVAFRAALEYLLEGRVCSA